MSAAGTTLTSAIIAAMDAAKVETDNETDVPGAQQASIDAFAAALSAAIEAFATSAVVTQAADAGGDAEVNGVVTFV